ncbi:hypothetical protein DFJ58DRAFT_661001 [Suillus subalutaceus]|uniref:uncharacterized protein n=1 Tax=Suillus subalutaceus TaxID=48586 RepID=UPI001B87CFF0|nr:uncharacterized protein DFJ58DRAFT_661001 [Suillus subalutaceus]KAG1852894.1 hypothetical protein DFJ58DRAFT_661001 [Suillus subalutaceus]
MLLQPNLPQICLTTSPNDSFNHDFDVSTIIPPVGEEGFSVSHGGGELELHEDLSNALSSQWHQALDEHFKFADEDKYATLSTFIYCNYVQALECIHSHEEFLQHFDFTPQDFELDLAEEHSYLEVAGQCKSGDSIQVEYVKALNDLDLAW